MSYRVTAPLVLASDGEGRHFHHYHGSVIKELPAHQAKLLLDSGMVEKIDAAEAVEPDAGDAEPPAPDGRPAKTAPKPAWVAYAADQGHGSQEELEALTKPEIQELCGTE